MTPSKHRHHLALAALAALAIVFTLAARVAAASTWQVNPTYDNTGCNAGTRECSTIGAAFALADPGDTLQLANGTYTEVLGITKSIHILGNVADPSLVVVNTTGLGLAFNNNAWFITADDVSLKGLTMLGGGNLVANSPRYAIKTYQADNLVFEDLVIYNYYRAGLDIHEATGVTVTRLNAHDNGGTGLVLRDVTTAAITDLTTANNTWGGTRVQTSIGSVAGIVFSGANSFGENGQRNGGLYTEQDPVGFPISVGTTNAFDVQVSASDFSFALTSPQNDGLPRTRYYATAAQAMAAAVNLPAPDHLVLATAYVENIDGGQFYVGPGMLIAPGLGAAGHGDTVSLAPGAYAEAVTLPSLNNFTFAGTDSVDRPVLTGGMQLGAHTNLTLRDLVVRGTANGTTVIAGSSVTDFTADNVRVDGESVASRFGLSGGQFHGDLTITDSEFVNINGWSAFDTRSGSGGPTSGSDLDVIVFTNNVISNTQGHINFRGTIGDPATSATLTGNLVEGTGNATNSFGGILKVFYATTVVFTGNTVKDVGTSGYNPGGEAAYGAGFMPRGVVNLTVTGNTFENNNQAIAFEPRNSDPGGFADGVLSAGTISDNTFVNNTYGVYVPATLHPTSNFAGLTLTGNRFSGSVTQAVHNGYAATLLAENNWWDAATGPSGAGPGSGEAVSTQVDYSPWCSNLACTTFAAEGDEGEIEVPPGATAADVQALLDDAPAGATLVIPAGTLAPVGGFVINNPGVTLIFEDGTLLQPSSPCFTITASDTTIIGGVCQPSSGSNGVDIVGPISNIVVRGMEIDGSATATGDGINITGAITGLRLLDNYIHDMDADGLEYATGSSVSGVHVVQGNLFQNNTGFGVNNATATSYDVSYNSWGHLSGPASGDGANGPLTSTPWTHAAVSTTSSGSPVANKVAVGASITYTVYLAANEVSGADFDLAFNNTLLTVVSITNSGAFTPAGSCDLNSVANANSTGAISFCGYATTPVTGPAVAVFQVVFQGLAGGTSPVNLDETDDSFSMAPPSGDSNVILANALTDNSVQVYATFTVSGQFDLQGRANESGVATAFQTGQNQGYGPYAFSATDAWGATSATGVVEDTYLVTVTMDRYLDVTAALNKTKSVASGNTTLSSLVLLGGDANDDNTIDIGDAALIGGNYGFSGGGIINAGADINADSTVNLLDLVLMGGNYGKTSASAYGSWTP